MKSKTLLVALLSMSLCLIAQATVTLITAKSIDKKFTQFINDLSMTDAEIAIALEGK